MLTPPVASRRQLAGVAQPLGIARADRRGGGQVVAFAADPGIGEHQRVDAGGRGGTARARSRRRNCRTPTSRRDAASRAQKVAAAAAMSGAQMLEAEIFAARIADPRRSKRNTGMPSAARRAASNAMPRCAPQRISLPPETISSARAARRLVERAEQHRRRRRGIRSAFASADPVDDIVGEQVREGEDHCPARRGAIAGSRRT